MYLLFYGDLLSTLLYYGADDIYVFVDAWRQSFTRLSESTPLDSRLSWTFRRAGGAMLVTTITTAVSFLANLSSPISAMKAFGIFTAMQTSYRHPDFF